MHDKNTMSSLPWSPKLGKTTMLHASIATEIDVLVAAIAIILLMEPGITEAEHTVERCDAHR